MNVYGLIGHPLEHSFSKQYFTEKFRQENITARFELFSISSVEKFQDVLLEEGLKGLAVTIPYKVDVIPFLTRLTSQAKEIGAVNCIEFGKGELIGHNTDVIGFERSLVPLLNQNHTGALILGSGGAAAAVTYVLEKLGLRYLIVSRRTASKRGDIMYEQISKDLLSEYPLIINCTPVGMHPKHNSSPSLPYEFLTSQNFLYDLIYNPEETLFLKAGRENGCTVKNGLEMLELQAEENWAIWNKD